MRLESYAGDFEDLFLFALLQDVRTGFYIDAGANDPTSANATKIFYDRGWHGINIEPSKKECALLEEFRPRDVNLCAGLGSEHGKKFLYNSPLSALSTFSEDIAKKSIPRFFKIMENKEAEKNFDVQNYKSSEPTEILTLTEIFNEYCSKDQPIHFCKIDVEGFEKEVLLGVKNWHEFRPWIFCIEAEIPTTSIPSFEQWEYILLDNGYEYLFQHAINRFYIDSRKKHLVKSYADIMEFFKQCEMIKISATPINVNF